MKKITVYQFNEMLKAAMNDGSPLRVGQAFYSELLERYEDIALDITGTEYDPFYDDELLYDLMKHICEDFV